MAKKKSEKQQEIVNKETSNSKKFDITDTETVGFMRDDDFRIIYTDNISFEMSPYDFKLTCSVRRNLLNGKPIITEVATIVLSPQHAETFSQLLAENVESYKNQMRELEEQVLKEIEKEKKEKEKSK